MAMRALVVLPLFGLLGLGVWHAPRRATVELELMYLCNEGFLVRAGEHELLIDAFVSQPYAGYTAVPHELRSAMLTGKPPFDGVELALTSHFHADHFQPKSAAEFLLAHPETKFISSPQVVEALQSKLEEEAAAGRVTALLPEAQQKVEASEKETRVELLRLPHSGGDITASVQNLGHLIEIGGARILHLGDADSYDAAVDHYDLEQRQIDVALVPFWCLQDADKVALAKKFLGAKHIVAVHVPADQIADIKAELAAIDPSILLFENPGDVKTLALER